MEKRAIHFGVNTKSGSTESVFFDGVSDAMFYHLLSCQRGYDSTVYTTDEHNIDYSFVRDSIHELKQKEKEGVYFITLSTKSVNGGGGLNPFRRNGKLYRLKDDTMNWDHVVECLAHFSKNDKVLFLIADCEQPVERKRGIRWPALKFPTIVKAKAAVLSIGVDETAPISNGTSSLATDLDFVLNSAKSIGDLKVNLEILYGNRSYVKPELVCYNLNETSTTYFFNN